jgi:CheY-like chemotaxis protein
MSSKPGSEVSFARELRDALSAIQMAMEVLRRPPDEATRDRMIELMERQLATLRALADRCDSAPAPGAAIPDETLTRRILVVDDNIDSAEVLGTLLEQLGHEVFVAYTGARAIEVAHERRPDVILLDLALPDVSGYDVARTLRRDSQLAGVRIIGLSGFGGDEHRKRALEAGLDDYVVKPVAMESLSPLLLVRR